MEIDLPGGKYVVAVSGGVDSVALLDLLARQGSKFHFIVAHFDHGIRPDSAEDRRLVQGLAEKYGLPFVYHEGHLGPAASEATARQARYDFLHEVRRSSGADAIITAHHRDDLLETVILNLLRGTGRRGLSSLKSTDVIKRPLLQVPKRELLRYAEREGLQWREDSTNSDEKYLRNYVRKHILPRFAEPDREALLEIIGRAANLNGQITGEMANYLHLQPAAATLDRHWFVRLPHAVAREIMAEWLLQNTSAELSKQLLERLVVAAKTARSGSKIDVDARYILYVSPQFLALQPAER
jgi:tRNA(Ile)-lysidine synthase